MKSLLKDAINAVLHDWQTQGKLPTDLNVTIQIERARDAKFGDFASNIAMLLAKPCQRKPLEIAQEIVAALPQLAAVSEVSVAPPGFINFRMAETAFQQVVRDILQHGDNYGRLDLGKNQRLHLEFVSANPTGPLHVGHGRHAAYGASLSNVLEAAGFEVQREYYVNDAGRQMRILALSVWLRYLQLCGQELAFPRRGYKGEYVTDIAQALKATYGERFLQPIDAVMQGLPADDEQHEETNADILIQRAETLLGEADFTLVFNSGLNSILQDIHDDLAEFGVTFHKWFHESELHKTNDIEHCIEILRNKNYLYQEGGATWFRSTQFGDEKDRVVKRENGQPTYFAADIAYHLNKYNRGFDKLLNVYGSDHHGYVPRLQAAVQALGENANQLEVLLLQFANLYRGETRVSMSTRGGEFVTLRELREEVGNDAARFFYILRKREQHVDFDLELAKSQSSDNPVYYIQYAHARICSVFRQLQQKKWTWQQSQGEQALALLDTAHEKSLLRCLSRYPEVIELAAQTYEPSVIAYYLQELANEFHAYYNAQAFLVEDEALRNARLYLIAATRQVLGNGLRLLGLSAPEMM